MRTCLVVFGLSALLTASSLAEQPASPDLFVPVTDSAQGRPPRADVGVARTRQVLLNLAPLEGADAPEGTASRAAARERAIVLNLFDDVSLQAVVDHAEPRPGGMIWTGRVLGNDLSNVTLVVDRGEITGSVAWPFGAYTIRPLGAGRHAVSEVDRAAFPDDEPEGLPLRSPSVSADGQAAADDGNTIDLMVVYTPTARLNAGGTTAIQNLLALGVSETNQAYANSGVVQRLRLVHSAEVSYAESGDLGIDLDRLTGTPDGFMDTVHALRDAHGADLVQLVVDTDATAGGCGIAWLMPGVSASFASNAFSVTERICISPNYTFGHELGHNMGLNHARTDPTGTGAFSYSFGYKDPNNTFRTVMAYNCPGAGCPRVLNFSNPNINYGGLPTGIATSSVEAAHNAQTLNNTRTTVANWRQSTGNTPGPATLVSPTGTVLTPTPTFTWNAVASATDYQLYLAGPTGSTVVQTWYSAATACTGNTCSANPPITLAFGAHTWQVLTSNSFGTGQWSAVGTFSVNASTLTLSATSVPAGQPVQVTVDEGPGLTRDWIGLYPASAPDTGYVDWKYLNGTRTVPSAGSPSALVTFSLPTTPGNYNLRFFQNNTYTRLATSATVTVVALPTAITVGSTAAVAGQTLQVTIQNGPGYAKDWVGMHATTAADAAMLDWKFLNGTRTAPAAGLNTATLTFALPTTAGTYNFRLFQNNTYTKLATSATVTVTAPTSPVLQATPTSLAFGALATGTFADRTVTVRNAGAGTLTGNGSTTGAGFSLVGGTSYSLAANQTAVLTVRFSPTAGGAASGALTLTGAGGATVALTGSGTTSPGLAVNTTVAAPGGTVQVTLSNGPGNPRDWVGLHATTAADTTWLDWKYLSGTRTLPATGLTAATIAFTMPTAPGTYNIRLFQDGGFTKLATSPTVTVQVVAPNIAVVGATTVGPGAAVQVSVQGGPANPKDWVAMHTTTAADTASLDWKYLNGTRTAPATGQASATLTFTAPTTPGTYNFRFFQNNTYTRLAISATLTVQ